MARTRSSAPRPCGARRGLRPGPPGVVLGHLAGAHAARRHGRGRSRRRGGPARRRGGRLELERRCRPGHPAHRRDLERPDPRRHGRRGRARGGRRPRDRAGHVDPPGCEHRRRPGPHRDPPRGWRLDRRRHADRGAGRHAPAGRRRRRGRDRDRRPRDGHRPAADRRGHPRPRRHDLVGSRPGQLLAGVRGLPERRGRRRGSGRRGLVGCSEQQEPRARRLAGGGRHVGGARRGELDDERRRQRPHRGVDRDRRTRRGGLDPLRPRRQPDRRRGGHPARRGALERHDRAGDGRGAGAPRRSASPAATSSSRGRATSPAPA